MGKKSGTLLLLLYLFLPTGVGDLRALVAQILLGQVRAIAIAQLFERRQVSGLTPEDGCDLLVFWLKWHRVLRNRQPFNATDLALWSGSLMYLLICETYGRGEAVRDLLLARWFDPDNTTACAYLDLTTPFPIFWSNPSGDHAKIVV